MPFMVFIFTFPVKLELKQPEKIVESIFMGARLATKKFIVSFKQLTVSTILTTEYFPESVIVLNLVLLLTLSQL